MNQISPITQPLVHILDDDAAVRHTLARLLQSEGIATRCWFRAADFVDNALRHPPGCLVMDFSASGMNGLELQSALAQRGCSLQIVFTTDGLDVESVVQGMRAGAVSFLSKPVQGAALLAAVRDAIARDFSLRSARSEQQRVQALIDSLTRRERQVLPLVATGTRNKQIAAQLGATEKTIKTHRGRVMQKMCVESAAALAQVLVATNTPRMWAVPGLVPAPIRRIAIPS
jgi:FixJ family two-component response regulator